MKGLKESKKFSMEELETVHLFIAWHSFKWPVVFREGV
jgi:hypothetical protein